jgi:glucose-6-phosphate 1-dehydrogenase
MMAITPGHEKTGACVEMEASRHPAPDEMDAYERLLGDAMRGNPTLFAREDSVEEAWRIVDPVIGADHQVFEYDPGTWGPTETDQTVCPPGGWHNPEVSPARSASRSSITNRLCRVDKQARPFTAPVTAHGACLLRCAGAVETQT